MLTETRVRSTPSKDTDAEVGRRIHMLMWDRQMTQTTLGRAIGIEQSGLAKKLRGQRGWALSEIVEVARVLEVSISELFGETPSPTEPNERPSDYSDDALTPIVGLFTRQPVSA